MIKSLIDAVTGIVRPTPEVTANLPIFPLGSVLFPGGGLALKVFETRYMDMAKACLKNSSPFGVALIRDGVEVGAPALPHALGTLARITEWDMPELGILNIRVRGEDRFRLSSHTVHRSGLIIGEVSLIANDLHVDCPELPPCAGFLRKVLAQTGQASSADDLNLQDAAWVSFRLTELMPFNTTVRQKMLELTDARMRLEVLHRFLIDQRLIAAQ